MSGIPVQAFLHIGKAGETFGKFEGITGEELKKHIAGLDERGLREFAMAISNTSIAWRMMRDAEIGLGAKRSR